MHGHTCAFKSVGSRVYREMTVEAVTNAVARRFVGETALE